MIVCWLDDWETEIEFLAAAYILVTSTAYGPTLGFVLPLV
jgi:hypothetical protein